MSSELKIKFKNQTVFGNKFDAFIGDAISFVIRMYIVKKINKKGYLIDSNLGEAWSYVYYLYYYNKTHEVFKNMKTIKGNHASARNFYKVILEYTKTNNIINTETLKLFINDVIKKHNINNPILNQEHSPNAKVTQLEEELRKYKVQPLSTKNSKIKVTQLEEELRKYKDQSTKLEEELRKYKDKSPLNKNYKVKVTQLEEELRKYKDKSPKLEEELRKLEEELRKYKDQSPLNKNYKVKVTQLEEELRKYKDKSPKLEEELRKLEEELRKYKDQSPLNKNYKVKVTQLEEELRKYKDKSPLNKQYISKLEEELRKYKDQSSKLEEEFKNKTFKFEKEIEKYEKNKYDLDKLRNYIHSSFKTSTNDVQELIEVIKHRLNAYSPSVKIDCKKDIEEFKKELKYTINIVIFSKMCLIKYLGDILNIKNTKSICNNIDISQQITAFNKLPIGKQNAYREMFKKHRQDIYRYQDLFIGITATDIKCNDLIVLKKQYEKDKEDLNNIFADLTNLSEDLYGSVRCYIKLRKFIKNIDIDDRTNIEIVDNRKVLIECNNIKTVGNFFGAFGPEYKNADMYSGVLNTQTNGLRIIKKEDTIKPWSLSKTFNQLEDGYSICLLTTGYSGSGKSFMFFGDKNEPGIVHYGLGNLNTDNINIEYVFELYYDNININEREITGKVIISYDKSKKLSNLLSTKYKIENITTDLIKLEEEDDLDNLNKNINTIRDHQNKNSRIKKTINNDKSSRSHLFIIFKVGTNSYLTLADLAGAENAFSIYESLFNKSVSLPYFLLQFDSNGLYKANMKHEKIKNYMQNIGITNLETELVKNDVGKLLFKTPMNIEDTLQKNVQILLESFYITETLNHMKYYFNKRNGKIIKLEKQQLYAGSIQYKPDRVFVEPNIESKIYMIPILEFINDLGSENTVSKFILCGAIKPIKCQDNVDTIRYLNSVSNI
jgi:hypothetical protein